MNFALSSQIRLIGVVALAGLAAVMGGLYFMTRAQLAAELEQPQAIPPVVQRPATQPAPTPVVPKAEPKATKPAKSAAVVNPVALQLAYQRRLPFSVARALQKHRVVVAALVVPDAAVDRTTLAEAKAGARDAGVGFVSINVLRERAGRALAARLGIVETPAIVVYRRPAKAFIRIDGFVDRLTVAQAAANARGR